MQEARKRWEIQLEDCNNNLQNKIEDILLVKIEVIRILVNERSFIIIYAKCDNL